MYTVFITGYGLSRLFNVASLISLIITHTNCVCIGDADIIILTPDFVLTSRWKQA